jgi:NAD(P)H-hydrate epimerase
MPRPLVFTREQVRAIDRLAVERYHLPSIVLMENAARGLADVAAGMIGDSGGVLIVCGPGNNGGDGLAAARHLHNRGLDVSLFLSRPAADYQGDALTNLRVAQAMNLTILPHDAPLDVLPRAGLVVDALFGTGLTRPVAAPFDRIIEWMNRQAAPVLAADLPSGLDADSGLPLGCCVKAAATATFVGLKLGFTRPHAAAFTGPVRVVDIGVPRELAEALARTGA